MRPPALLLALALCAIAQVSNAGRYREPRLLTELRRVPLNESSGLAASARHEGLYWSNNDGGPPLLYAFDLAGRLRATVRLRRAVVDDWEGLDLGPAPPSRQPHLYVGDIGDNQRRRRELFVYRLPEPALSATSATVTTFRLRYPDGRHDAEALLIHPHTGDLYIITKARSGDPLTGAYVARAPLRTGTLITLEKIADVDLPDESPLTLVVGRVTGGSISPDGRRVVLCDYFRGQEAVLPEGETNFDRIWRGPWRPVDLGSRRQGEAICYRRDGRALLATSEGSPSPLLLIERR